MVQHEQHNQVMLLFAAPFWAGSRFDTRPAEKHSLHGLLQCKPGSAIRAYPPVEAFGTAVIKVLQYLWVMTMSDMTVHLSPCWCICRLMLSHYTRSTHHRQRQCLRLMWMLKCSLKPWPLPYHSSSINNSPPPLLDPWQRQ